MPALLLPNHISLGNSTSPLFHLGCMLAIPSTGNLPFFCLMIVASQTLPCSLGTKEFCSWGDDAPYRSHVPSVPFCKCVALEGCGTA